jgi:hypothetical protein
MQRGSFPKTIRFSDPYETGFRRSTAENLRLRMQVPLIQLGHHSAAA